MGEGPSDHIKKRFTSSFQIKRSLTSMLRGNKMTELVDNGVKWTYFRTTTQIIFN